MLITILSSVILFGWSIANFLFAVLIGSCDQEQDLFLFLIGGFFFLTSMFKLCLVLTARHRHKKHIINGLFGLEFLANSAILGLLIYCNSIRNHTPENSNKHSLVFTTVKTR